MTNLEHWRYYHKEIESPDLFINWSYYALVSAALQRRVWFGYTHFQVWPNIFLMFVGPPAVGKTIAADTGKRIIKSFDKGITDKKQKITKRDANLKLAPDSTTVEGLMRFMHDNSLVLKKVNGKPLPDDAKFNVLHTSMAFFCGDEIGTLLRDSDRELVPFLTQAWDGRDFFRNTKTQGQDLLPNLCVTMLGSCVPGWVRDNIDSKMLKDGFTSRVIFVWGGRKRFLNARYKVTPDMIESYEHIRKHIAIISDPTFYGELKSTPEVDKWIDDWYIRTSDMQYTADKRLEDYYGRRRMHLFKTAMVVHYSEPDFTWTLRVSDLERAERMLIQTEKDMHIALAQSGRNALAAIADQIYKYLVERGACTQTQLVIEFFDMGTKEEILSAVEFLREAKKIHTSTAGGKIRYIVHEEATKIVVRTDEPDEIDFTDDEDEIDPAAPQLEEPEPEVEDIAPPPPIRPKKTRRFTIR